MKKNILIIIAAVILIAAGAWWYNDSNKILSLKISATDVPPPRLLFTLIKDRQLDKKYGLDLELLWAAPGEVERRLATRFEGVEIGFYNILALVNTNTTDKNDLRIIAPAINNPQVLIVKKESQFKTIADLKGSRLAVRPVRTAAYNAESIVMKLAGFDKEKDFKLTFGTPQDGAALLEKGEVDSTIMTLSDAAVFLATGKYRPITTLNDTWMQVSGAPFPFVDFAAHQDWISSNPKKLARFRSMLREAVTYIKQNPKIVDEYKNLLNIKATNDIQMESARKAIVSVFSETWDFKAHKFLLNKAVELGYVNKLPAESLFAE